MTTTTAPLTEARDRLSEIIDDVVTRGAEWTITRHGRPVAVLIGHDEYEALIESLNILSDDDAMAAIAEAEADLAEGRISED
ncbi:MAG: type II toxin-antitoxin system Phd/YefM family antitoxin [Actinobacteria bacterium]|nr:type II toxin-antitoxin system Phd/YefM family antitoxin [Actinomycetota bacterium]MBU1494352.1 type II toxin-antitoxin system Phd/YefM family antitoxin [Actinomycetota bacterium]MBU1866388.1 type II toxin-antitoxin system Phd/YefM family antitoxin [Actinomycetota bacterium]